MKKEIHITLAEPRGFCAGVERAITIVEKALEKYGSPTLSDQSKISFPSIKIGPGDSTRSHTANEFIYIDEIKKAIPIYLNLLNTII